MLKIRAVSFDLDDTLWPVEPVIHAAEQAVHDWFCQYAPAVAQRFDVADLKALRQTVAREYPEQAHDLSLMRRLSLRQACLQAGADPALSEPAFQAFFSARNRVQFYGDVSDGLSRLATQWPLLALSNGNADLNLTGLSPWFQFGISAIEAGAAKPDPAMFFMAANRLGLKPEEIVHIGDDPASDVAGARAAGCKTILLDRHGLHAGRVDTLRIASLHELPSLLQTPPD